VRCPCGRAASRRATPSGSSGRARPLDIGVVTRVSCIAVFEWAFAFAVHFVHAWFLTESRPLHSLSRPLHIHLGGSALRPVAHARLIIACAVCLMPPPVHVFKISALRLSASRFRSSIPMRRLA
jgi:hypothetical protein